MLILFFLYIFSGTQFINTSKRLNFLESYLVFNECSFLFSSLLSVEKSRAPHYLGSMLFEGGKLE